jgi:MFS family permease
MTFVDLDPAAARAGGLACVCGPEGEAESVPGQVWRLAAAFGLAIFAQAMALTALSVAGGYIAPRASLVALPFAAYFAGAAAASVPASLLLDQFGRRAAFAIGASLGVAGGALAAYAVLTRQFPGLCVGAFWLGAAQGFALFYRHAAANFSARGSRLAIAVLSGGAFGALLAPIAVETSQAVLGPLVTAAMPALAAAANLLALPLVLALPHRFAEAAPLRPSAGADRRYFLALTLGALGWFTMTRAMAQAPLMLMDCGFGVSSVVGAEGAHLVAMYAPLAMASLRPALVPTQAALLVGLLFASLSLAGTHTSAASVFSLLTAAAFGWSLLQVGVVRLLHDRGRRSAISLGVFDAIVLISALAGACADWRF